MIDTCTIYNNDDGWRQPNTFTTVFRSNLDNCTISRSLIIYICVCDGIIKVECSMACCVY